VGYTAAANPTRCWIVRYWGGDSSGLVPKDFVSGCRHAVGDVMEEVEHLSKDPHRRLRVAATLGGDELSARSGRLSP